MNILNRKYSIHWSKELTKVDHEVLLNLYQPIIGASAIGLYNTLILESNWSKKLNSSPFMLERVALITSSSEKQLKKNLGKLTKLKLIKCLKSKKSGNMAIVLNLPLSPKQFFENDATRTWLLKKVGEENFELAHLQFKNKEFNIDDLDYEIEDLFENNEENELDFIDIEPAVQTTKKEVYICEQSLNLFDLNGLLIRKGVLIEINESVKSNLDALLLKKEFDIQFIAELMINNYKKTFNEIDWINLNKEFNAISKELIKKNFSLDLSDDDINVINSFNSTEWINFYNKCMGVEADQNVVEIISSLKLKYNLSDGILNCLISYSYLKNNKKFIYNYVVKIVESLKAKKISTTKELYMYLKNVSKRHEKNIEKEAKENSIYARHQPVSEFVMEKNIDIEW
ncbi:DnaD domain protein [Mesoplasma tabanidae]|uniref:Chromosome replication initiation and membrane attachment protein n=1 Tax=Mesoplasma tabanidae TaxID=219745 RepID=A0A2K8P4Z3_9MOLU|nr:DnaD domain protein [Mesoplasma tabanidae]ATZ21821.1 chromosome replication initiation and membrane attachment protein [Mesoplasma tabanidae]